MMKDDETRGRKSAAVELSGKQGQEGRDENTEEKRGAEVRAEQRGRQTSGKRLQRGIKQSDVSQRLNRRVTV